MLDRADAIFKLAMAVAALCLGFGVGYYYGIFLPGQAAMAAERASEVARTKSELEQRATKAKADAIVAAKSEYEICLTNVQADYNSRWQDSCKTAHDQDERARNNCVTSYGATNCTGFNVRPATDCSLPNVTAESYDSGLQNNKRLCLDRMKASQI